MANSTEERGKTGFWSNFNLMMYKVWLEKIRRPISFLLEIILPILVASIIYWIYQALTLDYIPSKSYHKTFYSPQEIGNLATTLRESNKIIAIAPDNKDTRDFVDWWCKVNPGFPAEKLWPEKMPDLIYMNVTSLCKYIRFMDSSEAMDEYLDTPNIGFNPSIPDIYVGIVFDKISTDHRNWTYTIRPHQLSVPAMYSEEFLMNDYQKRMSSSGLKAYARADILEYSSLDSIFNDEEKVIVHEQYLPGFSSIQRSIDRYLINKKYNRTFTAKEVRNRVVSSFSLKSAYRSEVRNFLNSLSDEELERMKPYGEAFIQEQLYMPQSITNFPFPTNAYRESEFFDMIGMLYPIFFLITFLYPCFWILRNIVNEKEKGIRETLKTMGLRDLALVWSWLFIYTIEFLAICIGCGFVLAPVFEYSNIILLVFYFFCFAMSLMMLCYLISSFFSRAKTAGLLGILIIFVTFIPTVLLSSNATRSLMLSLSIDATVAFSLGIQRIASLEAETTGLQIGSLFMNIEGYSIMESIVFLIFDSLLYYLLGRYFDQVIPKEYGLTQPWYFLFTKAYWRGEMVQTKHSPVDHSKDERHVGQKYIEEVPKDLQALGKENKSIEIKNLVKVFDTPVGPKIAVNDLNVTMYEGQIFCLLGHNGAGKTTTISMLSGMIPISEGSATVYGLDIREEMPRIRNMMAVCPQFDILWDNLTVREHLYIAARLQNVPKNEIDKRIKSLVYDVGLTEKLNKYSKTLSGGQVRKRKLSVAMALIGNSKVVFLDEPTSGMDPYSRRMIWNLLRNYREDRIIILTTHFMDEADLLGDRIGIMSDGQMFTCGTSHYLKHQFGVGYNLTIVKEENCDSKQLENLIMKHIPKASLLTNVGAEMTYQLPFDSSNCFVDLFTDFDTNMKKLGITTYGVSVTTMEEVFLNSAKVVDREFARSLSSKRGLNDQGISCAEGARHLTVENEEEKINRKDFTRTTSDIHENLFFKHFAANFIKRMRYALRDKKMFIMELLIPAVYTALVFTMVKVVFQMTNVDSFAMDTHLYNSLIQDSDMKMKTRFVWDNYQSDFEQAERVFVNLPDDRMISQHVDVSDLKEPEVCDTLARYLWCHDPYNPPAEYETEIIALSRFLLDDREYHKDAVYNAGFFNSINLRNNYLSLYSMLNTTSPHATPIFINSLDVSLYRMTHDDDDRYDIHVNNHPLPLNKATQETTSQAVSLGISQHIVIALAFVPAYTVLFLVKEREVGMKHQEIISGISIPAYWLSEFIWDTLIYVIVVAIELFLMWAYGMDDYLKDGKATATLLLLFLYGTASTSFVSCLQFLFKSHTIGLIITLFINILCVIMELASFIMTAIENTCIAARYLNYYLFYLFPGFGLGLGLMRLGLLSAMYLFDQMCDYYHDGTIKLSSSSPEPLSTDGVGVSLIYLGSETVVYLLIAILLDYATNDIKVKKYFSRKDIPVNRSTEVDDDVAKEEKRVMSGVDKDKDVIQLKQLRKVYNGEKVAVDRITFGLQRGQCFGLLGINGAGKTTTFSMISGENAPTKGTAILCGMDMIKEPVKVRRLLGMCPQSHALLDLLTVREHLELFGRIKGVPPADLNDVIEYRMEDMGIKQYEHKKAQSLSGGNKRKLSVAQALIGNPPLVLMDEPSTGMDPVSRRALWDIISMVSAKRKECTIIITTHSMEEAEALCTKVGIMVGGRLRCFGTIQDLKSKFGHGYTLNTKFCEPSDDEIDGVLASLTVTQDTITRDHVKEILAALDTPDLIEEITVNGSGWVLDAELNKRGVIPVDTLVDWWITEVRYIDFMDFLEETFNSVELLERHGNLVTLRVDTKGMKLSEVFKFMEEVKEKCSIEEYSIAQMTLEQIFNFFASQQEEETREIQGMVKKPEIQVARK